MWADGIYLQARLEDAKQCILVIIGATPEGRKELLGFTDGARESAQDWRELLLDLKNRGLAVAPELAVADGALGFWKALGELWPTTREQRCWVHKTANVLNKLPKHGEHEPSNGLLLRRDIHSLFDRGYVTVTPGRHFEVSRRIRDEFENGRDYYAMHGTAIRVPDRSELQPDPDVLRWHNENRFLG